jgi:spore maturation protein B
VRVLILVSNLIIPLTFVTIILYGMKKKVKLFEAFIEGAEEGLPIALKILPTLIGLMVAVGVLRASGALNILTHYLSPIANAIGYPVEAIPLTFMRLVSSAASSSMLIDIFREHGPDSFIGRFVSVMMSSTETVFYTMSIYFLSVKITKTRYTLAGALFANFVGVITSLFITILVFGR